MADDTMDTAVRTSSRAWQRTPAGDWRVTADGERVVGLVREVAGAYEARVLRHPTGPTGGPDPEEAHGPQVFEGAADAVRYVESNLPAA